MGIRRYAEQTNWFLLATSALVLAGCGGGSSSTVEGGTDYATIAAMSGIYSTYLREHNNQPPPDEQTFRDFLETKQENLQRAGLTVEGMFVSPRSGQPFQWVYGGRLPMSATGAMQYVGYETTPVDGKRLVIATRRMYEMLDDAQFRAAFPNAQ